MAAANVQANADFIGGNVTNKGILNLTGGALDKIITGGNVVIDGDVTSNASIASAIGINADKTLTINAKNCFPMLISMICLKN